MTIKDLLNAGFMSVVCRFYVGFMSVLCQYVKLYFIELQKYIMILCRMSVTFADLTNVYGILFDYYSGILFDYYLHLWTNRGKRPKSCPLSWPFEIYSLNLSHQMVKVHG